MTAEEEERHYIEGHNVASGFFANKLAAQRAENALLKNRLAAQRVEKALLKNRIDRLLSSICVAKEPLGKDKEDEAFAVLCGAGEET